MCRHSYEYEGQRTYGGDIPGYAQGAYFPGDEPCMKCALTDEACVNPENRPTVECPRFTQTDLFCPQCLEEGEEVQLLQRDDGMYCCPCSLCEAQYESGELLTGLSAAAADFRKRYDQDYAEQARLTELEAIVAAIKKAVTAA